MARSRAITAAIIRRAKVRATLEHLAWNPDLRLAGIVACGLGAAAWIFWNATRFRRVGFVAARPPIGCPFPDVPDHVVGAIAVRRKGGHGRRALIAVGRKVL